MSKALDTAERKGRDARRADVPRSRCPYDDHRTSRGAVTFSRAFMRAWLRGWDAENKRLAEREALAGSS